MIKKKLIGMLDNLIAFINWIINISRLYLFHAHFLIRKITVIVHFKNKNTSECFRKLLFF